MMKRTTRKRKAARGPWGELLEQMIAEMLADPRLTDKQKAQLLADLEKPDAEWKPVKIKGEPLSETIIKMRGPRP
ncbi:MAG: hypothetical protein RMM98_12455 [Acidobacteriota bacterium]|nr:hypothetical protein [Blastocatellia bacterium]MDW8240421.1 hypothetical protein [Acidobacteriota bacterium]